jgi:hypothetical protein
MWTALSILLALAFLQNAQAGVYRVRDDDGASPLVLFRDTDQPGIFYFLPTAYNLVARSGTGRGLGIQFFSDAKAKEKIGVSVTLSVASGISPAQLLSASDFLRQRFGLADPRLVPIPKQLTRISIYGDGSPTTPLAATRWNSTTSDSTQSLSFTVSNITKQDALRLLSADAGGLVILVETQVAGEAGGID